MSAATSTHLASLEVEPLAGAIGAVIRGVDLADLDDATVAEIRRIWLEHLVVFFRDQELDDDAFLAFARRLGEPVRYPFVKGFDTHPEIIEVAKLPHETVNFGGIWHSDTVYLEQPPMATMLLARELPPFGGDTMFANMYAAYEALSPGMRAVLDGARRGQQLRARRRVEDPGGPHPRPRTGRGRAALPLDPPGRAHPSGDRAQGALREPGAHRIVRRR